MNEDEFGQVDADTVHNLSMAAIKILHVLLGSGIIVDTLSVFCWLSNQLAFGLGHQWTNLMVLENVLQLLIGMVKLQRESEQISAELRRAATFVVKRSLNCAVPCNNTLHRAVVNQLSMFNPEGYSWQQTETNDRRMSEWMFLVRILVDEGGPDLVNLVNRRNETAAHRVVSLAKERFSSFGDIKDEEFHDAATELLTLFDEYGQHWDSFYNSQHSLLEVLKIVPQLSSFWIQLRCQPAPTLQCLSATVAVAWSV